MSPRMVLLFEFHFETEFYGFKLELNCLNQLFKKNRRRRNLSLSFQPSPNPLFLFSPAVQPKPAQHFPQPGPVGAPSPAPADRQAPPVGPVLFLRLKRDSSSGSPGRARPAAPCRDPHSKAVRSGL